jgi:5-hydroxyisourate hydrolase
MGQISTHVLDTVLGLPAAGVVITLHKLHATSAPEPLARVITNADGRASAPLLSGKAMQAGQYELAFHVGDYFRARHQHLDDPMFLDIVPVRFQIADAGRHCHVPLLVSPHAYSTYRGS